ncbi:hypothetical protein [Nocardia terpenica]|uniref:DUF8175 domain-containing protein n=1 Tax=Nocardia terpenica TaxID=455432 RepID=A0A6G9Z757_9NOCA|nr:hypothetical protein [Nocardia terpenica]QIS20843.1 hypothetical protein F6W96_23550 [Nocardia terpenica]
MSTKDAVGEDRSFSFGVVASAAVIALIVVVGVFMFVTRGNSGGGQVHPATPPAAAAAGTDATGFADPTVDLFGRRVDIPNNPAGQPLPQDPSKEHRPSDQDWLTAAPAGTTDPHGWQRVYGASVPFSTSDGPTRIEDGLAVGYSHTPQGAVLAAAQITYRLNARPADRDLYVQQVRASAQQIASYDKARSDGALPQQQPERITRYLVAPDAFQVENYADDMAIVRLAARGPVNDGAQTWAAIRLIMVWDGGDWRLKPTDAGTARTDYVTSLGGWTKW